jgi:hypothetical protein
LIAKIAKNAKGAKVAKKTKGMDLSFERSAALAFFAIDK